MSKEAMKLALGELQAGKVGIAMQILREALAEQPAQQEPIKQGWDVDTLLDKPIPLKDFYGPAQQEPEHIVHSNGRYSPLLTRMMNERVKSNVKQVIELYDSPEQPAQQEPVECKTLCELCVKRSYHFCANSAQTTLIPSPPAQRKPLTDDEYEALVEDLEYWSRYVEVDTAHQSLEAHVRKVLAAHGIKENT